MDTIWFSIHGDREARLGPFKSHVEAVKAVMDEAGYPLPGCYTWPEEAPKAAPREHNGNIIELIADPSKYPIDIPQKK